MDDSIGKIMGYVIRKEVDSGEATTLSSVSLPV